MCKKPPWCVYVCQCGLSSPATTHRETLTAALRRCDSSAQARKGGSKERRKEERSEGRDRERESAEETQTERETASRR